MWPSQGAYLINYELSLKTFLTLNKFTTLIRYKFSVDPKLEWGQPRPSKCLPCTCLAMCRIQHGHTQPVLQ